MINLFKKIQTFIAIFLSDRASLMEKLELQAGIIKELQQLNGAECYSYKLTNFFDPYDQTFGFSVFLFSSNTKNIPQSEAKRIVGILCNKTNEYFSDFAVRTSELKAIEDSSLLHSSEHLRNKDMF